MGTVSAHETAPVGAQSATATLPPTARDRRWMAVGHSGQRDGRQAGAEAATLALCRGDAKVLIVFASVLHDLPAVLAGVNQVGGRIPVIGCTTHGEICVSGPHDGSVVVAAIGGDGFSVTTSSEAHVSGRQREAGAELASRVTEAADDEGRPHRVLIMLTDGMTREQEMILRGAYSVVGATVPLFGGAAGDAGRMKRTFQFHGSEVLSDAAVAAYVCSDAPLAVAIGHGWSKVGDPMSVTAASGGRVNELDDRPALDAYLERLEAPRDVYEDPVAFSSFALSRPVGVQRRSGEQVVNFSTEVRLDDRSLGGGIGISQGSLVWPMTGTTESILDAVGKACAEARAGLEGREPVGYLTFSCAALRAVIGDAGIADEAARLVANANGAPFAGFYTYGEIARTRGIDGFHNQTFVVLSLA
jgi:hypothetical protein